MHALAAFLLLSIGDASLKKRKESFFLEASAVCVDVIIAHSTARLTKQTTSSEYVRDTLKSKQNAVKYETLSAKYKYSNDSERNRPYMSEMLRY